MTAPRKAKTSVNEAERTVELTIATPFGVERRGYGPDNKAKGVWTEHLSMSGAKLGRLQGAPLTTDHDISTASILGVIDSARREKDAITATARFSRGVRGEAMLRDVQDSIIRSCSIGYRVLEWAALGERNGVAAYEARSWEPLEVSLVGVPADPNARVRSHERANDDTTTDDANRVYHREVAIMTLSTENEATSTGAVHTRAADFADDDAGAFTRAAVAAENVRVRGIQATARDLNLAGPADRAEIERLLDDGVDLATAKRALVNLAAQRSAETSTRPRIGNGFGAEIDTRAAIASAIAHRLNPNVELVRGAEVYAQMPMAQIAETVEREAGRGSWLGRSSPGYMTSGDFASVLALGTETAIAQAYQALPPALLPVARKFSVADLQAFAVLRPTTAPKLLEVNEHGEIKSAPLDAAFETMSAKTFARMVNLSRNLVLADRLEILSDFVGMSARSAANTLGDLLHTALVGSPVMSDGVNFYATGHGNVSATGTALNLAALEAAFIAMRSQQNGSEGSANVVPRYLVVGPSRELAALQLLATIAATEVSQVSPYGSQLSLIVEPRITDGSFYVLADPARTAALGYAVLSGTRKMSSRDGVPLVDIREGWTVLGLEVRTVLDAGSAPLDWRSAYRNLGN